MADLTLPADLTVAFRAVMRRLIDCRSCTLDAAGHAQVCGDLYRELAEVFVKARTQVRGKDDVLWAGMDAAVAHHQERARWYDDAAKRWA